jgi:hypothetical protein
LDETPCIPRDQINRDLRYSHNLGILRTGYAWDPGIVYPSAGCTRGPYIRGPGALQSGFLRNPDAAKSRVYPGPPLLTVMNSDIKMKWIIKLVIKSVVVVVVVV